MNLSSRESVNQIQIILDNEESLDQTEHENISVSDY